MKNGIFKLFENIKYLFDKWMIVKLLILKENINSSNGFIGFIRFFFIIFLVEKGGREERRENKVRERAREVGEGKVKFIIVIIDFFNLMLD